MAVTAPGRAAPVAGALPAGPGPATPGPVRSPRSTVLGMVLFVVADAMVLLTLLAVYFTIKGGSPTWPPKDVKLGTYLPTMVTITVGMSMASMAWMLFSVRANDQRNAFVAALLTVLLGLASANAQWYSLLHANFGVGKHAYGTLYFLLVGYALVHVIAGVVMVAVVAAQSLAGHFSREDHEPVRAVTIFWQFGSVAWFAIVFALFLLSRHAH